MKRRPKLLLVTLLLLPILAIAAFNFARSLRAPNEADMLANFRQNEGALNQLVEMARADDLVYIGRQSGLAHRKLNSNEYEEVDVSENRLKQYRVLMKKAGTDQMTYSSNRGICRFRVIGSGGLDTSWSIGYAWANNPKIPMRLVKSAFYENRLVRDTIVYSTIKKNWYLYNKR